MQNSQPDDRLNDSLDDLLGGPVTDGGVARQAPPANYKPVTFDEPCRKCGGSGSWRGRGQCFACKGTGKLSFKTSAESRAKSRTAHSTKKANAAAANVETFKAEHAEAYAWMVEASASFPFAESMLEAVQKYGDLTDGQMAAVKKCIAAREAKRTAAVERANSSPGVDTAALETAFATAVAAGLKRPSLRIAGLAFSRAKPDSKNPGALYVKGGGYLGKVAGGKFVRSFACSDADEALVIKVLADPKGEAIAHGKRTGSCACCGRELTNGESIELGIGPICAGKWGW